ncbi:unnamed protein product, partial [Porites lobata]
VLKDNKIKDLPPGIFSNLIYLQELSSSLDGHQPTQDKRYKNGVSLCGFAPTVELDPKVSIGRCYQSPGSCLCNISSRLYCNYLLFGFQNTSVIGCRGFLASASNRIVCLVPKFSHHTPAFIIYIVYQCTSATSATRPPSSRWCWPCLPKEVSKF